MPNKLRIICHESEPKYEITYLLIVYSFQLDIKIKLNREITIVIIIIIMLLSVDTFVDYLYISHESKYFERKEQNKSKLQFFIFKLPAHKMLQSMNQPIKVNGGKWYYVQISASFVFGYINLWIYYLVEILEHFKSLLNQGVVVKQNYY